MNDMEIQKALGLTDLRIHELRNLFEVDEPLSVADLVHYMVTVASDPQVREPITAQILRRRNRREHFPRRPSPPPSAAEIAASKDAERDLTPNAESDSKKSRG